MGALKAQLDGTAGPGDFETAYKADRPYQPANHCPIDMCPQDEAFPLNNWYRLKPKPKLRPFTPEEAGQLVGAVAVSTHGRRVVLLKVDANAPTPCFVMHDSERIYLEEHAAKAWKWKWPHEDDSALRPFGKEEV